MMGRMATDIGAAIRARRQQLRLTQRELAERVGVHPSSVVNWEKGRHPPDRNLGALEEVLGISLDGGEPRQRTSRDQMRETLAQLEEATRKLRAELSDEARAELDRQDAIIERKRGHIRAVPREQQQEQQRKRA